MPRPQEAFDDLYPCEFYTQQELLDEELMYSVYEIARLLQGLETDAEIDEGVEDVLLDWAIPWIMRNSAQLVIAEPPSDEEPGYYGLKTDAGTAADTDADAEPSASDD